LQHLGFLAEKLSNQLLNFAGLQRRSQKLAHMPSWVSDWMSQRLMFGVDTSLIATKMNHVPRSWSSYQASASTQTEVRLVEDDIGGRKLVVKGILFDKIQKLNSAYDETGFATRYDEMRGLIHQSEPLGRKIYHNLEESSVRTLVVDTISTGKLTLEGAATVTDLVEVHQTAVSKLLEGISYKNTAPLADAVDTYSSQMKYMSGGRQFVITEKGSGGLRRHLSWCRSHLYYSRG
jgi:hypothetical protein